MDRTDEFAIDLLGHENIDAINKAFYERYNFPWAPTYFVSYRDMPFVRLLNQDIGHFRTSRLDKEMRIWVAGCGTNQAINIALRYPFADVLGTDSATTSLEICSRNAGQLGIKNLKLEERNLNFADYESEFDYIICTGVIHHNAQPVDTLRKLSFALKPGGVLEMMVYNYYHRLFSTAIQKAIRLLTRSRVDFELQYKTMKMLIEDFPGSDLMQNVLSGFHNSTEAEFADSLLQPVEHSYTVGTLGKLADAAGLEYLHYCLNDFDVVDNNFSWNLDFKNPGLKGKYDSLPDEEKWQIGNLLKLDESPRLWFYFQRRDSNVLRKTEAAMGEEFLNSRFKKVKASATYHFKDNNGRYGTQNTVISFPTPAEPANPVARAIYSSADLGLSMRELFELQKVETTAGNVDLIRKLLCTVVFPYLVADND